jgi:hypothetical protein
VREPIVIGPRPRRWRQTLRAVVIAAVTLAVGSLVVAIAAIATA